MCAPVLCFFKKGKGQFEVGKKPGKKLPRCFYRYIGGIVYDVSVVHSMGSMSVVKRHLQ